MCGDGFASTLEFSVLHPRVSDAKSLQVTWPVQPSGCNVFEKMSLNQNCKYWLENYGQLLNHNSETPLNSLSIQKKAAPKCWDSNLLAGTVLRMPGDTIHAGPPSSLSRCRGIFFFSVSEINGERYDPSTQWNELTLTIMLLEELWHDLTLQERLYFLKIARDIQANPNKAPSDSCIFITNMTLRLFIRISIYYESPKHEENFNMFLQKIAAKPHLPTNKQLITKSMLKSLDPDLLPRIFESDGDISPFTLFRFKN
jgi:hypothetical protein